MITIDKIRAEIKRLQDIFVKTAEELETEDEATVYSTCAVEFGDELLSFLDTLPDESEQPTRGYDEAYLNEKIAKASKSWEGVDVDKFIDEIRGREPVTDCHKLKQEIERTYHDGSVADTDDMDHVDYENIARHFAEWGAEHAKIDVTDFCKPIDPGIAQCGH